MLHYKNLLLSCLLLFTAFCASGQQEYADSLEKRLNYVKGPERIRLLNDLTFYYFQQDVPKAVRFGEEALRLARKQTDKQLLANTLNDYSMPFLTDGNFHKVVELNNEALKLRLALKDSAGLIGSHSKLGNAYFELAQYDRAIAHYSKALDLAKKLRIAGYEMQILINLGNVMDHSGMYQEAYKLQKRATVMADKLNDLSSRITSRTNLATVSRKLKRYKEAERYYFEAIPLIRQLDNNTDFLAGVYQGLGVMYREQGNHEKGIAYYKKSYALYKQIDSKTGLAMVAVNIGNYYATRNQLDSSAAYYTSGLSYSRYTRSYRQMRLAYEGLSGLEEKRGNHREALRYMKLASTYKDSVQLFQGSEALSEMYAKYETVKKEQELAQSRLANSEKDRKIARAELKLSRERLKGLVWLFTAVALVVGGFFFFRNLYRKRKAAQLEVEATKKSEQLRRERELNEQKISISRELHDNIGSQLTYMISSMDNLTYKIKEDNSLSSSIAELSDFGRGTMQELRSTIWAMNAEDGSVELLFRKLEELRSKIPVALELQNGPEKFIPLKAIEMLNLYRIGQEALQNCIKYAGADTFSVTCTEQPEGVMTFVFSDNGSGFDPARGQNGNGLRNMRHRCEQIGGTFAVHSEKGTGTTISCALRHLTY